MKYLIVSMALVLVGCDSGNENTQQYDKLKLVVKTFEHEILTAEVEGHKYIIYAGCYKGNIIHAESCPCKVKRAIGGE